MGTVYKIIDIAKKKKNAHIKRKERQEKKRKTGGKKVTQ